MDLQPDTEAHPSSKENGQYSIFDQLHLTTEHTVFKWTSLDTSIKCSEIVASINVEKVMPKLMTLILEQLCDLLPNFCLQVVFVVAEATGSI